VTVDLLPTRGGRLAWVPAVLLTVLSSVGLVAPGAQAAVAASAAAPSAPAATASSAPRSVADLRITGTTTSVTVRRIYRGGQVAWVSSVLQDRLVNLNGCQASLTPATVTRHVYRAVVHAVCPAGPGASEAAARALVAAKPWYGVEVERVTLIGFSLLAHLPKGNDRAVPAALARLPHGPSVFYDGDDVGLTYSGPEIGQAQFDAAVAAFAGALGVPASSITITPLAGS
jgi:hypothetical protein